MVVLEPLLRRWNLAQRKLIQHFVLEEQVARGLRSKDSGARGVYAGAQFVFLAREHELEELGHAFGVLLDLLLRRGIQDREAGVDVPFVCVDAERDVDFDVLDAADVARQFPRELVVGQPGGAHGEEGRVRYGLRVGGNAVVLLRGEVDVLGFQTGEHCFDEVEGGVCGAVFDQD